MSRFGGLNATREKEQVDASSHLVEATVQTVPAGRAKARQGKHGLVGYFSPDLMRAMRMLAAEEDKTIQALLGEAIDHLMRDRGKHPFGER